jgi:hypothetical protein
MGFFGTLTKIKDTATNTYRRAYSFLKDRLPYNVKRYIEDNSDKRIEQMWVYRQPIQSVLTKIFNILSLSKWDEAKNKLGYDDMFHLYIIVQLNDNTRIIMEKNQDINIGPPNAEKFNGDKIEINLNGKQPTLLELLENTRKYMGDNDFYTYDSFKNNCQHWVYALLKSNNLLTPQLETFIKQDAEELLKTLPDFAGALANKVTDAGSNVNRFLQTIGLKGFKNGGLVI